MDTPRRDLLRAGAAGLLAGLAGCAVAPAGAAPRVVVVGGGYGGATAARYIRMRDPSVGVVLVEPDARFVSCPLSNLVIGGFNALADVTVPYDGLARNHGVRLVRDRATAIDMERREACLECERVQESSPRGFPELLALLSEWRARRVGRS